MKQRGENSFPSSKKWKMCLRKWKHNGTSTKLIPLLQGNKDFTAQNWTGHWRNVVASSSPVYSVCVYKLFSSSRVWSRTWCMPRFSSLADDSFSGEKKRNEKVNLWPAAQISADVTLTYPFIISQTTSITAQQSFLNNSVNNHATISNCIAVP